MFYRRGVFFWRDLFFHVLQASSIAVQSDDARAQHPISVGSGPVRGRVRMRMMKLTMTALIDGSRARGLLVGLTPDDNAVRIVMIPCKLSVFCANIYCNATTYRVFTMTFINRAIVGFPIERALGEIMRSLSSPSLAWSELAVVVRRSGCRELFRACIQGVYTTGYIHKERRPLSASAMPP